MDLELDLELTLPHDLRWEIDGTEARDGVDPKLRSKSYDPNMDLELDPDPELHPPNWPHFGTHGDKNLRW